MTEKDDDVSASSIFRNKSGVSILEYALLAALIGGIGGAGASIMGGETKKIFSRVATVVSEGSSIEPETGPGFSIVLAAHEIGAIAVGSSFSFDFTTVTTLNDPGSVTLGDLSWSISEGVPPEGLNIDAATGVLSGTATETGSFSFDVAGAFGSTFGSQSYAISVLNAQTKLTAVDGALRDRFGTDISISNGVVVVGAQENDDIGTNSGSAYLFDVFTGAQTAKLLPSDGAASDFFGFRVAIDNGVVIASAVADDDNGSDSGSTYLFDASTGVQTAKLLPSDGAALDLFGYSVAIDNGIVAVGARDDDDSGSDSGSVYIFDVSTGAQLAKLLPNDGEAFDWFGSSVAIDSGIVVVGAFRDDNSESDSGSAYVFDASTGDQIAKLQANDGSASDWFGYSVAIDSGIVVVGSRNDDDNGTDSGSVYLFDAATGVQIMKILPSDGAAHDLFGYSVAIDSGIVAVGARDDDDNGSDSGSVYIFDASTGAQLAKLLPDDGVAANEFGNSVAIHNRAVAIGAVFGDGLDADSGSAYVFPVP